MCCCCFSLHRHQVHLISYGCVSFGLITTGFIFTVFAIFYKDTQIGKVWLAGPTTMVVGLVLCGKVVIDWGPAMLHARQGSLDSVFMDPRGNPVMNPPPNIKDNNVYEGYPVYQNPATNAGGGGINGELLVQESVPMAPPTPNLCARHPRVHQYDGDIGQEGAIDCIVYQNPYELPQLSPFYNQQNITNHQQQTYSYTNCRECDTNPQSPLGPLRGKLGMLKVDNSVGHSAHMNQVCVMSSIPSMQMSTHGHSHHHPQPIVQSFPNMHRITQRTVDAHSPLLPQYNAMLTTEAEEVKCDCGKVVSFQHYRQQIKPQTPPATTYDYGSVQRNSLSQVYQGETFVLNEKNYFI